MLKWIKRIVIGLIILIGLFFVGMWWFIREAFGPTYRIVKIRIDDSSTLIGDETYNADFAAVFYDVDFQLRTRSNKSLKLGSGTFSTEDWDKSIHVYFMADWIVLPVKHNSYAKILLTNKRTNELKDTILSPDNLRYDSLWKEKYQDIPSINTGSSQVDSISGNKILVAYEYRIGEYEPFRFYSQTVEYFIDPLTGNLATGKVFERQETKPVD